MNSFLATIAGGIFAGLISTFIYATFVYFREEWILWHNPLICNFRPEDDLTYDSSYGRFFVFFYLENRTNTNLHVVVTQSYTFDPQNKSPLHFDPEPIEWVGRSQRYGVQSIILEAKQHGDFILTGSIDVGESLDITIGVSVSAQKHGPKTKHLITKNKNGRTIEYTTKKHLSQMKL